jgi:hypothetical protein
MLRSSTTVWRKPVMESMLGRGAKTRVCFASSNTTTTSTPALNADAITNPASRPYARHRPGLPQPKSFKIPGLLFILFSIGSWTAFTLHATNRERLSSSVLKNIMEKIKDDQRLERRLGSGIGLERKMLLAGDPWINGSVNMMQGKVDMSFRVKGSKGELEAGASRSNDVLLLTTGSSLFSSLRFWKGILYINSKRSGSAIRDAAIPSHSRFEQRDRFAPRRIVITTMQCTFTSMVPFCRYLLYNFNFNDLTSMMVIGSPFTS